MTPTEPPRGRAPAPDRREAWRGVDLWATMIAELLAGLIVLGGLGFLADRYVGTEPWGLGVGIMLGFAAGLYLIWLRTDEPDSRAGDDRRGGREG